MSTPTPSTPEPLYALFHVNRNTGERVRFQHYTAKDRASAEADALWNRQTSALVPSHAPGAGDWTTEAHPDSENARD